MGLIYCGYCCLLGRLVCIITTDRMCCECGNGVVVISFCCGFTVNASGLRCIVLCVGVSSVVIFWLGLLVVDYCVRFSVLVLFAFVGLYGCCVSCFACCCLGSLVSFWFGDLCTALLFSVSA